MHHEYRRPCSRSRPCHERSTGDIKETPGGQLGDSKGPAGRHSEGSKISYMDQCTFGAVRPRRGRGPARRRRSQNSGDSGLEVRPSSVDCAQNRLQGSRRPASRPSPLPPPDRGGPVPHAFYDLASLARRLCCSQTAQAARFFKLLFFRVPVRAADAHARITAKAIPPWPDRRTKLCPGSSYLLSATGDNPFKRNQKCLSKIWARWPRTQGTFPSNSSSILHSCAWSQRRTKRPAIRRHHQGLRYRLSDPRHHKPL